MTKKTKPIRSNPKNCWQKTSFIKVLGNLKNNLNKNQSDSKLKFTRDKIAPPMLKLGAAQKTLRRN